MITSEEVNVSSAGHDGGGTHDSYGVGAGGDVSWSLPDRQPVSTIGAPLASLPPGPPSNPAGSDAGQEAPQVPRAPLSPQPLTLSRAEADRQWFTTGQVYIAAARPAPTCLAAPIPTAAAAGSEACSSQHAALQLAAGSLVPPTTTPAPPAIGGTVKRRAPARRKSPYTRYCLELRPLLPTGLGNAEMEETLGQAWKALSKAERAQFSIANRYPKNPYTLFCRQPRPLLPTGLRNAERERTLGQMWKALPDAEKASYKVDRSGAPPPAPTHTTTTPAPPSGL